MSQARIFALERQPGVQYSQDALRCRMRMAGCVRAFRFVHNRRNYAQYTMFAVLILRFVDSEPLLQYGLGGSTMAFNALVAVPLDQGSGLMGVGGERYPPS